MDDTQATPKNPVTADGQQTMYIKVYSPFKTYFDGFAKSISAVNDTGPFDILPHHHNFITLLNPCDLVIRSMEEQKLRISRGILIVKKNEATVFLDV